VFRNFVILKLQQHQLYPTSLKLLLTRFVGETDPGLGGSVFGFLELRGMAGVLERCVSRINGSKNVRERLHAC
jgi:hypothetical protein